MKNTASFDGFEDNVSVFSEDTRISENKAYVAAKNESVEAILPIDLGVGTVNESGVEAILPIDLGVGTVMKGNAFARVDSVEAVSKKRSVRLLHPMTILFPESKSEMLI